ncbi:hypothetical protein Sjap_000054 [Stephania japonica]|uniref:RING-type domain-containing protein n=1 Tax=Stephania japonica TaxID=461633 RepID=A0AAP0PS36_9MAGN
MASSIASSHYDHVLRDHNRRDGDGDGDGEREIDVNSLSRPAFKKSCGKGLVKDHHHRHHHHHHHFQTFNPYYAAASDENNNCYQNGFGNNEGEITQLSNCHKVTTRASNIQRDHYSRGVLHSSSVDLPSLLRASSLVQMWKEFEAEAEAEADQSGSATFRLNSATSNGSVYSDYCDSADDRCGGGGMPEDSSTDCESDLTATSETFSPSNRGISDISERVRVADIIRRYTSGCGPKSSVMSSSYDENEHNQSVMLETETSSLDHTMPNHGGQRELPFKGITLRIRGRQAFLDLMKQIGCQRQREIAILRERHAVSRFTHRGRIQSLLKLRFLRQRGPVQDQCRPISTALELSRLPQRTGIFRLRERFDQRVGQDGAAVPRRESSLSREVDVQEESWDSENSGTYAQKLNLGCNHQEVRGPLVKPSSTSSELNLMPSLSPREHSQDEIHGISHVTHDGTSSSGRSPSEHLQEEPRRISNVAWQRTRSASTSPSGHLQEQANGISDVKWQRTSSGSSSPYEHHWQEEANGNEDIAWQTTTTSGARDPDFQDPVHTAMPMHMDIAAGLHAREEEMSETNLLISQHEVESFDRWDSLEVEEDPHLVEPTDMSGLSNNSGLHTNWEGERQPWLSEMQEHDTDNVEIRDLLGRRRVSSLLASGFRARMERLVLSYLQRQGNLAVESTGEGDSFERQYDEAHDEYFQMASGSLQLPQPSQLTPWNHYDDQEINENSDAFPSTTSFQSPQSQSQSHYRNSQLFSSLTNQSSLEIDLIYDLRGHLASLHQEMAELQKSMKSCMEMQMTLRSSIKQEVAAAVSHSIHGEAKESFKQVQSKKGNCCICYETKIDSLLYRCGHMCTCFNCANELQWSSSKCPICRAPILDVVRAYPDT